jgi:hypothetical protein
MVMLVIRTQYHENYGAHDWDGTGECPHLSWFERSQLQFDGAITSKEPAMTYQQVLDKQRELA